MTFTYTEDLTVARDYVRFHTGDTVSDQAYLTDEIITSLLAVESSTNAAVIAAIEHIMARLSQPNFRADWLQVAGPPASRRSAAMTSRRRWRTPYGRRARWRGRAPGRGPL